MNDKDIEFMIDEVIKRLELRSSAHKVLLLMKYENKCLKPYLEQLKENEYCVSQLLMGNQAEYDQVLVNGAFHYCEDSLTEDIKDYELIVVSGIHFKELASIENLEVKDEITNVICEGLRQGKKVEVFSEAIDWSNAKMGFADNILKIIYRLESYGISFPGKTEGKDRVIDKEVIGRQDLRRVDSDLIVVDRRAIFTESARELIQQRNIEVIRK